MKKIITFFAVFLFCLMFLFSCNDKNGDSLDGTYYEYKNGIKQENSWLKLENDTWSDEDGAIGRLEIKDGTVYGYGEIFGSEEVFFYGTIDGGVFRWTFDGNIYYNYYKDGSYDSATATDQPSEPKKIQYTVSFDSKGGTAVSSVTIDENEKLTAPNQPTRTMYIFNGWYKESGCKNVWDFDTDVVTGNITLYAKWQADEVRITSVEGASIDQKRITIVVNDTVDEVDMSDKVILNSDTATWKLYFDRAGESQIRTKIAANRSGNFIPGDNLFYIVVTSADETQETNYVLNIYQKYEVEVLIHDVYQGLVDRYTTYTTEILSTPQARSFTGYTFNGWRASDATFGEPIPMYSERALHVYPNVTPNTYQATLNAGEDATFEQVEYIVTYDGNVNFAVPQKTGYTFKAWAYGEDVTDSSGRGKWTIDGDVTLTARYTPNIYELSATTDDEDAGTATLTGSMTYGETFTLTATTNEGYTLLGWYDGNRRIGTDARLTLSVPAENKTYTAKWTFYTVTTNTNLPEAGTYTIKNQVKTTAGNSVTLTANTNYGYTWLGWYDGDTRISKGESLDYTFTMSEENKTYTAKWSHFSITYKLDGGVNGENPTYFTTFAEIITLNNPTKVTSETIINNESLHNGNYSVTKETTAYTFLGWYSESTFDNKVTEIIYTGSNVVLYAKWSVTTSTSTSIETEQVYTRENNYIYFGMYPQSEVMDNAKKSALTSMAGTSPTSNWTPFSYYVNGSINKFMWYIDLSYCGEYYRGIYFTSYRPSFTTSSITSTSYQINNGYHTSTVYWFKYDPIKWRILSEENGEALILCEMIIDSQEYYPSSNSSTFSHNGGTGYANNYALSNIRKWLNNTFYNTSFSYLQREIIERTTVDNSVRSTRPNNNATEFSGQNNTYICANTIDRIFLLSEQEVTNSEYGFNEDWKNNDTARKKQATAYAQCQGLWNYTSTDYLENGNWWLRTPRYDFSDCAMIVGFEGDTGLGPFVDYTFYGVVPALKIRLL